MEFTTKQFNKIAVSEFILKEDQIEKAVKVISKSFKLFILALIGAIVCFVIYFLKITKTPDFLLAGGIVMLIITMMAFLSYYIPFNVIAYTKESVLIYNINKKEKIKIQFSEIKNCTLSRYNQNYFLHFTLTNNERHKITIGNYANPEKIFAWYDKNWKK